MTRSLKPFTLFGLAAGLALLAAAGDLTADVKVRDAEKYIKDLRTSKDPKAKAAAITELGKIGQIQKALVTSAIPDMMKALEDKDAGVRAAAAKAVGMVDPEPTEAVPALLKLMTGDKDESVKLAAIQGLGAMGESAKEARKDLQKVAGDDKKGKLGREAKNALKSINPPKKK